MSLVLIPILIRAIRANGEAVSGARVRARLTVDERDNGIVVPLGVDGETDAHGEAVINLWPNSRGMNGSQYRIVIDGGDLLYYSGLISVPETPSSAWPVEMDLLINQPPYPAVSVAEAAQKAASASAIQAIGANAAASAARDEAVEVSAAVRDAARTVVENVDLIQNAAAQSSLSAEAAAAAEARAIAAANAAGPVQLYRTYADALADVASHAPGAFVDALVDETRDNAHTRYEVAGGALVFALNLDQWRVDLADPDKGTTKVGDRQAYTSARARTQRDKNAELPSVLDWPGVDPTGATSSVTGFSLAVAELPAVMGMSGPKAAATRPDTVRIRIPAGVYLLDDYIDLSLRDVIWVVDQGAKIAGAQYLGGTLIREGQRIHRMTCSTMDPATGFSVRTNTDTPENGAEVTGLSSDQALSLVKERASVGLYVENRATPSLFTLTGPTYAANSVSFASAIDKRRLVKGMIIDTAHAPDKYSGVVTGVSADAKTIFVSGWYRSAGVVSGATTPPNDGSSAIINPVNKAWALNLNGFIFAESHASELAVAELGLFNYRAHFVPGVGGAYTGPRTWGWDAVNLGTYQSEASFMSRGNFHFGYVGHAITANFKSEGTGLALQSHSSANVQIELAPAYDVTYQVLKSGSVEAGSRTVAGTPFYDYHTSGAENDFDVRLIASGGTAGTNGAGLLTVKSGGTAFSGQIRPETDNQVPCGTPDHRWSVYYGATGTISTSDARLKTTISEPTEPEIAAAIDLGKALGSYKWLSAIEAKGDAARAHIGLTVQRYAEVMASHGLDPWAYGMGCYDAWGDEYLEHPAEYEQVPVLGEPAPAKDRDGNILCADDGSVIMAPGPVTGYTQGELLKAAWIEQTRVAGDRYSLRYDELHSFILMGIVRRLFS